jgi:hypothetical protein
MHNIRSTFPLDEPAIFRSAMREILTHPITWAPFVPVVAAYTVFDVPWLISAAFGAAVFVAVAGYWRGQWRGLTDGLRHKMIDEHNRAQNVFLSAGADELRQAGSRDYAKQLEDFVTIKGQIEHRLHEDGTITGQKIQIEQLVDSLCFGVRDQLTALARRENGSELADCDESLSQVSAALETLRSTLAELDTILGPSDAPGGAANASLEEVTRRLREEAEIARRVRARLRQTEIADSPAEPRPLERE